MLDRVFIVAAALLATPVLAADFVHTDGTAYVVPAGVKAFSDTRLNANQATFFIERAGVPRAGVCILSIGLLPGPASRETWEKVKARQRTDPASAAARVIKAPDQLLRIDGVRDLTLTHGGDGVVYWLTLKTGAGREQMQVNLTALIGTRQLFSANCSSEPGLAFTAAELDRILAVAASVKARPLTNP